MGTWVFHPGAVVTSWLLWVVGPVRVEGLEHVPRTGPMLVVANHCSNLDPPTVGWAVGHRTGRIIHFMAKEEMRSWPVAGLLARDSGVIFVRRGAGDRSAQRLALATLEQGGRWVSSRRGRAAATAGWPRDVPGRRCWPCGRACRSCRLAWRARSTSFADRRLDPAAVEGHHPDRARPSACRCRPTASIAPRCARGRTPSCGRSPPCCRRSSAGAGTPAGCSRSDPVAEDAVAQVGDAV